MTTTSAPHPADLVAAQLRRRDPSVAERILDALLAMDAAGDDLDEAKWGAAPSDAEHVEAMTRNAVRLHEARLRVLADTVSRADAAALLGVSAQQVSHLLAAGDLVALHRGRDLRLPTWQFDADTPKGRLTAVRQVVHAWGGGVVTLSQWMNRPNPTLGRRTPVQALRDGDSAAVCAAATAKV